MRIKSNSTALSVHTTHNINRIDQLGNMYFYLGWSMNDGPLTTTKVNGLANGNQL